MQVLNYHIFDCTVLKSIHSINTYKIKYLSTLENAQDAPYPAVSN